MNDSVFSLSAKTLQGTLTQETTIQGMLTSQAMLEAVLTQGPMIVNDYVFTVEETETMYIFTARRGSETQTIRLPKSGSSGVDFTTDETLTLDENKVLRVNTADEAIEDNTLPITSAAVATQIGNIEILLKTI